MTEASYTPSRRLAEHAHGRAGFCMVLEGGFTQHHRSRSIDCTPATVLFCPANVPHVDRISERGSRCLEIEIDPALVARRPVLADRNVEPRLGIASWFAYKLRSELHRRDVLSAIVIEGCVLALLGEFGRQHAFAPTGGAPKWLERVRERLDDEFATVPSLSELAAAAGVHRVHLARAFRAHFGCTVGDYVRQRRITFASRQLLETKLPLSGIALSAGFADQSHFSSTFKRLVGVPPGLFRARAGGSGHPR